MELLSIEYFTNMPKDIVTEFNDFLSVRIKSPKVPDLLYRPHFN